MTAAANARRLSLLATLLASACGTACFAQDAGPATGGRPLLEQLTRESQDLYADVQRGVLRVELPPPRWLDEADSPLVKYKGLDPKVREHLALRALRRAAAEGEPLARGADAASTQSVTDAENDAGRAPLIVIPPPQAPPANGPPATQPAATKPSTDTAAAPFAPNNVALVLDDRGHLLVPLYLEPDAAGPRPIRVGGAAGAVTEARFVGSDGPTNLTVLRLDRPTGEPLRLSEEDRPAAGSLVMIVAPVDGSARVGLWTGQGRDYGVVFTVDGNCAGVARLGQFLGGRACRLIAEQIIRHGAVKRATLGVIITQMPLDASNPGGAAGTTERPRMRVDEVIAGSAADRAGIRTGDLVVNLAGEPVTDLATLSAAIAAREGPTRIELLREGRTVSITVDLERK